MENIITIFVSFVNNESTPFGGPFQRFHNKQPSLIMRMRAVFQNGLRISEFRLLLKCLPVLLQK